MAAAPGSRAQARRPHVVREGTPTNSWHWPTTRLAASTRCSATSTRATSDAQRRRCEDVLRAVEITPFSRTAAGKYPWKVSAAGPGHGIQLRNGRLIPALDVDRRGGRIRVGQLGHRPSAVSTLYSDDQARLAVRDVVADTNDTIPARRGLLLELAASRVLLNFRSERRSFGPDRDQRRRRRGLVGTGLRRRTARADLPCLDDPPLLAGQ